MKRITLRGILRELKGLMRKAGDPYTRLSPKIRHNRDRWQQSTQEAEFQFHKEDQWRPSPDFMAQTSRLFAYFGFSPDAYKGKTIIDLGAGSKLRTKYFRGARIIAIEPLAERFMKEIEWCDLCDAERVYSAPAEERIEECINTADLVISINVLDHCYDFERIVENIAAYLKTDGIAFLSFDKHRKSSQKHPLRLTEAICEGIFTQKGLIVEKCSRGAGEILRTYGGGDYCLNYWLRKVQRGTAEPSS